MRIHGGSTPEVGQREGSATPQTNATSDASATEVAGAAPVVVSARAQEVVASGQRDAVAHGSRLSALKDALSRGTYKVDYDKLADKIVTDEIERARQR
jgi:anti-sigma28 factor (negative regulator of flagellin synthesis)